MLRNTENFGNSVPDDNFQKIFEKWKTGDPDANAMYQSIESSEDIHTYQVVWDKEWNCYPDTGELEKNGIMEETVNPDCKRFRKC